MSGCLQVAAATNLQGLVEPLMDVNKRQYEPIVL